RLQKRRSAGAEPGRLSTGAARLWPATLPAAGVRPASTRLPAAAAAGLPAATADGNAAAATHGHGSRHRRRDESQSAGLPLHVRRAVRHAPLQRLRGQVLVALPGTRRLRRRHAVPRAHLRSDHGRGTGTDEVALGIDGQLFKAVAGSFPTGVTIVTATAAD